MVAYKADIVFSEQTAWGQVRDLSRPMWLGSSVRDRVAGAVRATRQCSFSTSQCAISKVSSHGTSPSTLKLGKQSKY